MAVSKELKRLIKRYVKIYGYRAGRKKAYQEYDKRKKAKSNRYKGIWRS